MKKFVMMAMIVFGGCTYGDDVDDVLTNDVEQEATVVTVNCDFQNVKDMCKECGGKGTLTCCRVGPGITCQVTCTEWLLDPKTGKTYCK